MLLNLLRMFPILNLTVFEYSYLHLPILTYNIN